jgi:hypothetical protein
MLSCFLTPQASNESLNNSNEQSIYGKLAMGLLSSLVGGAK